MARESKPKLPPEPELPASWPELRGEVRNYPQNFIRFIDLMSLAGGDTLLRNMVLPKTDGAPVIPGALQRYHYVRALLSGVYTDVEQRAGRDIDQGARVRAGWSRLFRQANPMAEFIVAEEALQLPPWIEKPAMHEQLTSLVQAGKEANTTIRIAPAGTVNQFPEMLLFYPRGPEGLDRYAFSYLDPDAPEIEFHFNTVPTIEKYWSHAWNEALPIDESREMIVEAAKAVAWKKSDKSSSHSAACVEFNMGTFAEIRDSKNPGTQMYVGENALRSLSEFAQQYAPAVA